jgi:hypothetical protein
MSGEATKPDRLEEAKQYSAAPPPGHITHYAGRLMDWLIAEVETLRQWVNDLHSGMYINCVYCGHRYGPDPGTTVAMAEVLKQHIEQCPDHPMSHLKIENERLRRENHNLSMIISGKEDSDD